MIVSPVGCPGESGSGRRRPACRASVPRDRYPCCSRSCDSSRSARCELGFASSSIVLSAGAAERPRPVRPPALRRSLRCSICLPTGRSLWSSPRIRSRPGRLSFRSRFPMSLRRKRLIRRLCFRRARRAPVLPLDFPGRFLRPLCWESLQPTICCMRQREIERQHAVESSSGGPRRHSGHCSRTPLRLRFLARRSVPRGGALQLPEQREGPRCRLAATSVARPDANPPHHPAELRIAGPCGRSRWSFGAPMSAMAFAGAAAGFAPARDAR